MPEFRFNILTGEWVIIATERAKRPIQFAQTIHRAELPDYEPDCPFCRGNESLTSREVHRFLHDDSHWMTRTVKNKFPALLDNIQPNAASDDCFHTHINGFGIHEVIIDTPYHNRPITCMAQTEIEALLKTYLDRYHTHERDPRVKHIIIFKNNGEKAGSSLIHPHSQLIATPIVSGQIRARVQTSSEYKSQYHRCLMCDMIRNECSEFKRIVCQNEHFVCFLPYAALSSFHTWIFPLKHHAHFGRLSDDQIPALAEILRLVLKAQERLLNAPDYNFVIRSAPVDCPDENYHWYISVIPRLTKTAGFEIGSNIYINGSLPEHNALELRNIVDAIRLDKI